MRQRACPLICGLLLLGACTVDPGVEATRSESNETVDSAPAVEPIDPPGTGVPGDGTSAPPPSTGDRPPGTGPAPDEPPATDAADTTPPTTPDTGPDGTGTGGDTGDGIGDELFPELGNPGIDVEHYDIDIRYDPDDDTIAGKVTLAIVPTEDREEFTLDSAGPEVSRVLVAGDEAEFAEEERELRITPASPLEQGTAVDVVVEYSATPDPGNSISGLPNGWFNTDDGSFVLNEPDGARSWLPSNDHPRDQATYTFRITVPKGLTAVANGALVSTTSGPDGDVWVWEESKPMTTYLILLLTGHYEIVEGTGPNGLPLLSVVLAGDRKRMQPFLDSIAEQIDFFDDLWGPYPLDRYGIAMTDSFSGLAMETLGRSMFSRDDFQSGSLGYYEELLLSHELAHQWYGDAVTLAEWKDIWLNESFATYAQWLWLDHIGEGSLEGQANDALATKKAFGAGSTGDPRVEELFDYNSYEGGAVVLQALRLTIGDDRFFELMRRWVQDNVGTSRYTSDFIALAEEVSGTDLTEFFDDWLFADTPPEEYPEPA